MVNGQAQEHYSRAKIYLGDKNHTMKNLAALGLAVDHGEYKKNTFFVSDFSAREIENAQNAGFRVEIIIDDVVKHYQEQNKKKGEAATKRTTSVTCTNPAVNDPVHFHLGSYAGYFTYTEMLQVLDSMQRLYPGLISVRQPIDTFHSIRDSSIYWVRISNNPSVGQPAKPQILYTALHHAREPGSLSATLYYMWYLLENYSTNAHIKAIVDNMELYFVPCVNPDGYIYNITTNPAGGGMMRKNMRDNHDGTFGVDLNRNYGWDWGYDDIGSSPITSSDTYRGTGPFSEPETQAMRWFAENHHFKINLNYHTYQNDLLYPWGYLDASQTADSAIFSNDAQFLTRDNQYGYGTCDQTLNYVANGDSDDWMYGDDTDKPQVIAMTPEIGAINDGFYPAADMILPDCEQNLDANINAASLLLPFANIHHTDNKILVQPSGYLHYNLQRLGFPDTATYTVSMVALGSYISIPSSPKVYTGLAMFQQVNDSMGYTLLPSTPNGQLVSYVVQVYNGYYYVADTVSFYYGKQYTVTTPSTSSLAAWVNDGWGVCTSSYFTPPACIQSSLSGADNYPDNANITITTANPIDLTLSTHAYLDFYAKWAIEAEYDAVAVNAAPHGSGAWQPLCGRHTNISPLYGTPVYNGQQPYWVQEEMDLADYLGQKIDLQYFLNSDASVNDKGYFFENVTITTVQDTPAAVQQLTGHPTTVTVYPNPAGGQATISVAGYSFSQPLPAILYDCIGREAMSLLLGSPNTVVDVSRLPANVYYLKVYGQGVALPVQQLVVGR